MLELRLKTGQTIGEFNEVRLLTLLDHVSNLAALEVVQWAQDDGRRWVESRPVSADLFLFDAPLFEFPE